MTSAEAIARASRCVATMSVDDQDGVPWCQYPLLAATGWVAVALMETPR